MKPKPDSRAQLPSRLEQVKWAAWFFGIVLVGAALRLFGLTTYPIWYDEGATFYIMQLVPQPWRLFSIEWTTDPPLLPFFGFLWYRLVQGIIGMEQGSPASDLTLRLFPWAFSVATIPLVYALARELACSKRAALIAMALTAVAPFHIYYAQEVRPYATMTVFGLAALICALRALRKGGRLSWIGMVVLLVLSMYNHFFWIWYWFALNVFFLAWFAVHRAKLVSWTMSQAVAVVGSLGALYMGFAIDAVTREIPTPWYPDLLWTDGLLTFKTFFAGYSGDRTVYLALFVLGVAACLYGLYALRRRPTAIALLLLVGGIPLLANLTLWQLRDFSFYQHRLFILTSLMVYILAGAGIAALPRRGVRWAVIGLFLVLTLPSLHSHYHRDFHPSPRHRLGVRHIVDNRGLAQHLRAHRQKGDAILHVSHLTHIPIRHYYLPVEQHTAGWTDQEREALINSFPMEAIWDNIGALPERIDVMAAAADRIWLVVAGWNPEQRDITAEIMVRWLDHHGVRLDRIAFEGAVLYLYDMRPPPETGVIYVADWMERTLPRYYAPAVAGPAFAPWDDVFQEQWANIETYTGDDLGIWTPSRGLLEPGPDGAWELPVRIHNPYDHPLELTCALMTSAETLAPMALSRTHPEDSRWEPQRHWGADHVDWVDEFVWVARLAEDGAPAHGLEGTMRLAPGTYRIGLRAYAEGPDDAHRAEIQVDAVRADGRQETVGRFIPQTDGDREQWMWHEVGIIESDGEPVTLRITLARPPDRETVYADLGRIVALPVAGPNALPVGTVETRASIAVEPGETYEQVFTGTAVGPLRADVVVYDPTYGIQRNVTAWVKPTDRPKPGGRGTMDLTRRP